MEDNAVVSWLMNKYLQWQQESGKIQSMKQFADHLHVGEKALSTWINGRNNPSYKSAIKIATHLNDYTILDLLGFARPQEAQEDQLAKFPPGISSILSEMRSRLSELETSGIPTDSPEAERIVNEILAKHGYKQISRDIS